MKVIFFVRDNLNEFGGGDRVQIIKTKEALERRGHNVKLATRYVANLADYDVVHLFNMQINPHSLLLYALNAKRHNKPLALSTIYWNPAEWLEHTPQPPISLATKLIAVLRYPFGGVPVRIVAKSFFTTPQIRHWLKLFITHPGGGVASDYLKRELLKAADIILPNGESEGELVQKDYGKAKASLFVPNGVENEFHDAHPEGFKKKYGLGDFVLSVGRVESRKNAVALAKAATKLKLPLVMIGNLQTEPEYTAEVRAAAPKALFIAEMPHEELGSAYAAAKVHAMVSWFETPGLSSLEAGLAGCNIVTTDRGTTTEYFDKLAWYCDPLDQTSIETALAEAYKAPRSGKLKQHLEKYFTWDVTAEVTERGYTMIAEQT